MSLNTTPSHPQADSYVTVSEADAYLNNRTDVSNWDALSNDQKEAILKMATKQIDTLRFFNKKVVRYPVWCRDEQELQFPRTGGKSRSGVVDSAGSNYFIDSARANQSNEPDDLWNDGAVIIIEGTGRGQTKKISDFNSSTGKITIDENWTTNPDNTSQYKIIEKLPQKLKDAVCEQALFITNGGNEKSQLASQGITSYSIGDLKESFAEGRLDKLRVSVEAKALLKGLYSVIGRLCR